MKNLQITVPSGSSEEVEEILDDYSSDVSSSEVKKNGDKAVEFSTTVESEDIDELTEELKDIKELGSGELSIRVLEQKSLIEKGQKTRGGKSTLSQEEIYSKAQEFSGFTHVQWALIAVSSAIAAYGLALDNLIVVIGAMMLAPLLSPFVSGALSLTVGDRKLMQDSFSSGVLSILLTVIVSFMALIPFNVSFNPTINLVVAPGILTVLLSLLVGCAAALTFSTGLRDQVAGVAVAIALVPPLAAVGIGLKTQDFAFAAEAATIALINVLAVIVSGSLTFKALGFKPSTYYRKKDAEKLKYVVPAAMMILVLLAVPVVYTSLNDYQDYLQEEEFEQSVEAHLDERLIEIDIDSDPVRIYVVGEVNRTEFDSKVSGPEVEFFELKAD